MKYSLLIFLWIAFGISHSYLVSAGFTSRLQNFLGKYWSFYRLTYNIISLVTFLPLLYYTKQIDSRLVIIVNPTVQIVLLAFSTLIIGWAFFTFDPLEFIGVRQVMGSYSDKVTNGSEVRLYKRGLYGIVRHPMYSATIVFMWSMDSTLAEIIMKVILTIYIVVGSILEERKLVKVFGMCYVDYQREVPMLIPFLK